LAILEGLLRRLASSKMSQAKATPEGLPRRLASNKMSQAKAYSFESA